MTAQEEALYAAAGIRRHALQPEAEIIAARIRNLAQPIAYMLDEDAMLSEAKEALAQLLALADALAGKGR